MGVGKLDLAKKSNDWGLDGRSRMGPWGFSDQVNTCGKADGMGAYLADPIGPKDPYYAYLDGRTPPQGRLCADDIQRRRRDFPHSWWGDTIPVRSTTRTTSTTSWRAPGSSCSIARRPIGRGTWS